MDKNLKRKELMALGVHDLRNIAREVGVVGPTMKVKETLVEEIIEIMSGEMQATSGTKRGRKAKANFLTGEAIMSLPTELSSIIQAREQQKFSIFGNMGYLSLNQNAVSALGEIPVEKQGFLLCENGEFYFFDISEQKSMVYISTQIATKFGLKIGDKVEAICKKMPGNNIYFGKDILKINDCEAKKFKRNFCDFNDLALSSTKWFCDDITEGELKILVQKNLKLFLNDKKQLLEFCNKSDIFVVFLGLDCSIPEQEEIEHKIKNCGETIYAYSDNPENCFENLINSINNAIIRAQSGEKVLVMLYNFDEIFNTIQKLTKSTNLSDKDIHDIVNKIQNLNRILKNNGTLTTLIIKK